MTEYIYEGSFNYKGLVKEIEAAGLPFVGAADTRSKFILEATLTGPQKVSLDAVVAAHDPDGMEAHKSVRRTEVKGVTDDILGQGIVVRTILVGTTDDRLDYYRSWHSAISARPGLMPVSIRGRNYVMYTVSALSDITNVVEAVEDRQKVVYGGEKALLDAIDVAATQVALDAVIDSRT